MGLQWCGGLVRTGAAIINLAGRAELTAEIQHVDLSQVAAVFAPEQIEASGLLSGRVPMVLTWDPADVTDVRLSLGRGRLAADPVVPGDLSGRLRFRRREDVVALIGAQARQLGPLQEQVIDTVRDFVFDRLTLGLEPDAEGRAVVRINASGRGRSGDPPLPIGGLTVNLRGVEDAFRHWMRFGPRAPAPADNVDDFFR
jgi:hypothetical protein